MFVQARSSEPEKLETKSLKHKEEIRPATTCLFLYVRDFVHQHKRSAFPLLFPCIYGVKRTKRKEKEGNNYSK